MTEHHYRHFEALCAVVSTALLVVDENQQCTYLNPAAEKLTGYTLAQLQGRPLDCIAHRWPRSTFASGSANGANSPPNSPYQGQIAIVGKDGHHCDLNFVATPLWQDERFCGTAIELQTSANPQRTGDASQTLRTSEESALKQANKQLEQTVQERTTYLHHSEERYRTLFKSIDQGFCIIKVLFDEQGTPCDYVFLETNPAFARHAAQADLVGAHVRTLAPDHEQHWYDLYGRVARTGTSEHCVNQAGHRWFDVYAFQVKDQEPDTVGVLLSDVTERKQAEEELRRAYSLLEGITAGSEDLIAALDLDFNFLYFNTAYQREFRQLWQRELHAGDNLLAAMQHWPEEQNKARELWSRALSGETFS